MKKHKFHKTRVELHKDGSGTVHHMHKDGKEHDVRHAAQSLDHIHDSLQDHLGVPNEGEAAADAGNHGIPEEQAKGAGIPMPPPPAAPGAGV